MSISSFHKNRFGEFLFILGAIALGMALYLLIARLFAAEFAPVRGVSLWLVYGLLPWSLLLPVLLPLLERLAAMEARPRLLAGGGMLLMLGLLHTALIAGLLYLLAPDMAGARWRETARLVADNGMLLFDALVFVALAARAGARQLRRQLQQKDDETYRLGRSLSDTKLQSLAMQLNPHFLFNTLNGLAVLIDKQQNAAAREMVSELSGFLRNVLRGNREKWVTLEEELEFIRQYLRIEQYRFGERLVCFEDCEPLALTARIPPMLLQPLFENAIVHGLADKQGECRLGFECRLYDRHLILMVFDNGGNFEEAKNPASNSGIGLANVRARLREVYGDKFSLNLEKKADGTLVTLRLPAYKDSQF